MEEKKNERQRLELEKELRLKNHDETGEKQRWKEVKSKGINYVIEIFFIKNMILGYLLFLFILWFWLIN